MHALTTQARRRPLAVMATLQAANGDLIVTGMLQVTRYGATRAEFHWSRKEAVAAMRAERFKRRTFWCLDLDHTLGAVVGRGVLPDGMRIMLGGSGVVTASIRDEGKPGPTGKRRVSRKFHGLEWHYQKPTLETLAASVGMELEPWEQWKTCPPRIGAERRESTERVLRSHLDVLHAAAMNLTDYYRSRGGVAKATAAATALDLWRRIYLPGHELRYWVPPRREYLDFMRPALFTGRTQVVRSGHTEGPMVGLDVDSMYPAIYSELVLPLVTDPWIKLRDGRDPFLRAALEHSDRCAVIEATVNVPEGDPWLPPLPVRMHGKVVYPTGTFRGRWMAVELRYAMSLGVTVQEIHAGIVFQGGERYLAQFMLDLWQDKASAPEGSHAKECSKGLLVGLAGKFSQRNGMSEVVACDQVDAWNKQQHQLQRIAAREGRHYPRPFLEPWPSPERPRLWLCDERTKDMTRTEKWLAEVSAETEQERAAMEERKRSLAGRYPQHANIVWTAEGTAVGRIRLHQASRKVEGLTYLATDGIYCLSAAELIGSKVAESAPGGMGRWNVKHDLRWLYVAAQNSYWGELADGSPLHALAGTPERIARQVIEDGRASTGRLAGLAEAIRSAGRVEPGQFMPSSRKRPRARKIETHPHVSGLVDSLL